MPQSSYHVVVVGGGISGLSTAFFVMEEAKKHELQIQCTVVERDIRWGGKILTNHPANLLIEGGPDSFLTSKPWALALCRTLGLESQLIPTITENNRTFSLCRGALRELPQGLLSFRPQRVDTLVSGGLLSWRGLLRMGAERFWPNASSKRGEESLASFFRRRFGTEAFDYLIEPLVAGIYAGDAEELSLEATFPRFRELEQEYGSVIKGMRAVQAKAQQVAKPSGSTPASLFMTLRNGLGDLIDTLTQRLTEGGVQLMSGTGCLPFQETVENDRKYSLHLENGSKLSADAVVLTTPAYQTAQLLQNFQPEAAVVLTQIPYTSTATVSLAYPTEAVTGRIRGFGFVVPRKEQRPILAGTWTSLKWPDRSSKGETLIRCYVGGRGREHILDQDDDCLVEVIRQELQAIVGIVNPPNYREVHRWVRGMPQYVIGHQDRVAKLKELMASSPRLQIIGAGLCGIGIPDCIREGERVAERLMQSFQNTSPGTSF